MPGNSLYLPVRSPAASLRPTVTSGLTRHEASASIGKVRIHTLAPGRLFILPAHVVLRASAVKNLPSVRQQVLAAIQVFEGFPLADDAETFAIHHDLGRARPRVVV